ncbi:DUF2934 domain-containing protein [Paracoccus sediminis]|uniref:DUF2934 domain-containing protein n=1 Tax=Paracoccus sediminis TaxID=1214787 RepID=A0A238WCJ0_9RHOB|nr:DUF2934 domain-containing protein [Paracoccus sediminis]TBN50930.1 DUF2934 domain-containing protein [Paracoccus sediminis]SNR44296.1 Protein of unknown function [Paracoccus sediminis]
MNDQERIKQRAHEIWESEGRPEGREAEHWSRAEEELRSQSGGGKPDAGDQSPELEQTVAPAEAMAAAPKKRTRKAKTAPTPYLNDGP